MFRFFLEALKTYEVTHYIGEELKGQFGGQIPRLFIDMDVNSIFLYLLWKNERDEDQEQFGLWTVQVCEADKYDVDLTDVKSGHSAYLQFPLDFLEGDWMDNIVDTHDYSNENNALEQIARFGDVDKIIQAKNEIKESIIGKDITLSTCFHGSIRDGEDDIDADSIGLDIESELDFITDGYEWSVEISYTKVGKKRNREPVTSLRKPLEKEVS